MPDDAVQATRKVGRPPRINRAMIAEAAHEIGLDDLTLKAVADRLGVSVAGLYHHISGKDDLLRLAAGQAAQRVAIPDDHGQHWAMWLREWAHYNREAFVAQPGLLGQYLAGAISAEAIAANADAALGLLVRQGFSIVDAHAAYDLVSSFAIGSAVSAIRERAATVAGHPTVVEYQRVLALHDPDELAHLRLLVAELNDETAPSFDAKLTSVLVGIAVQRGERWRPIAEQLLDGPDAAGRAPARPTRTRRTGRR